MILKTSGLTKAPTLTLHRTTTPLTGEMSPPGACEAGAASASRTVQGWVSLQLYESVAASWRLLPIVTAAFAEGATANNDAAIAAVVNAATPRRWLGSERNLLVEAIPSRIAHRACPIAY